MYSSGKLLILAMFGLGVVAAGASWLFRYGATHRAAELWGPRGTRLIRDAPVVTLTQVHGVVSLGPAKTVDVSRSPGMTHLRNALLEDRSFDWASPLGAAEPDQGGLAPWLLTFRDPDRDASLLVGFSQDCRTGWQRAGGVPQAPRQFSTAPIADGLVEMFTELSAKPGADGR